MKSYSKNEKVQMRIGRECGIVVDSENDVRFGWIYQIKFADGSTKWFKSGEIQKAE